MRRVDFNKLFFDPSMSDNNIWPSFTELSYKSILLQLNSAVYLLYTRFSGVLTRHWHKIPMRDCIRQLLHVRQNTKQKLVTFCMHVLAATIKNQLKIRAILNLNFKMTKRKYEEPMVHSLFIVYTLTR